MDLWIRSQEKGILLKTNIITFRKFDEGYGIINYLDGKEWFGLGLYKTKERALEVLDEIQSKLKSQFIVKSTTLLKKEDIDDEEARLNWKYQKDFIMQDSGFEIIPVNNDIAIYEMPKE